MAVTTRRRVPTKRKQASCPAMSMAEFLAQEKEQDNDGQHGIQLEQGERFNVELSGGLEQEIEEETSEEPTGYFTYSYCFFPLSLG